MPTEGFYMVSGGRFIATPQSIEDDSGIICHKPMLSERRDVRKSIQLFRVAKCVVRKEAFTDVL
eukprot:6052246-Amphidinium_carterae.1